MTITSTNRKGKNAWGIPSLKTYLISKMVRKKRHQANCILKYFENMMIDHSDSTIF
jgi:hypothetical protein